MPDGFFISSDSDWADDRATKFSQIKHLDTRHKALDAINPIRWIIVSKPYAM
ncbi:hypothetical protein RK21_04369 [Pseudomonas plecoglossicida]|nr:hypothetical protein RK21_04369 [Pseudomonas plecoglossicida]